MIPDDLRKHKPQISPVVPREAALILPDHDAMSRVNPDGPATGCPVGFCQRASAVLDLLTVAREALSEAQAALEEVVLP